MVLRGMSLIVTLCWAGVIELFKTPVRLRQASQTARRRRLRDGAE